MAKKKDEIFTDIGQIQKRFFPSMHTMVVTKREKELIEEYRRENGWREVKDG